MTGEAVPATIASWSSVLTPPAAEQLERITAPALIITAEHDLDA